jgi:hypothetical protein
MAYQFPLNGGRINATIGGNTAGVGSLVSTGTLTLAGGNNVTLSQNGGNVVTIHGAAGGGGSVNFSAGTTSNNLAAVTFSNSNGVSFGLNGSTITASHNGITSQTAQTLGLYASGANTIGQSSSSTIDARSFNFSGQGAISAGYSGSTMQLSVPQTSSLSATGAVSISTNGSTVFIGAPTGGGGGAALSAGTQSVSTGTVNFANSNGITFGMSGSNQITASHNGLTSQTVQTQNMVSVLGSTGDISFANGNGVTFGGNNSTLTASVNTSYAASNHSHGDPTLALTNLSGTTASASNGLTISLSAAAPGGGGGIALSGGGTSYSNGTVNLSNHGGALTISGSTNSVLSISVPQTSSLSATGAVSISTDGSTIFVGAGGTATMWYPYNEAVNVVGAMGQGSLGFAPVPTPGYGQEVQVDRLVYPLYFTNASNTTGSLTVSLWMGLYTRTASSISLAHSLLATASLEYAGNNNSSNQRGIRLLSAEWATTIPDSRYFVGIVSRTTTGGANASLSQLQISQLNSNLSGMWNAASNATAQWPLGVGFYSATTAGLPVSVAFSQINGTNSLAARPPSWHMISGTA